MELFKSKLILPKIYKDFEGDEFGKNIFAYVFEHVQSKNVIYDLFFWQ